MPRTLRVECPGAIYRVVEPGDPREDISVDDVDRQDFLETLADGLRGSEKRTTLAINWIAARLQNATSEGAKSLLNHWLHAVEQTAPGVAPCVQLQLRSADPFLLDRIDLHVEVPPVKFREISAERTGESSAAIRQRVVAARRVQQKRFEGRTRVTCNARMGTRELKQFCELDETAKGLIQFAMSDLNLSARAYDRILKVARTIADLAGSESIAPDHVSEAIQYRSLDCQVWG